MIAGASHQLIDMCLVNASKVGPGAQVTGYPITGTLKGILSGGRGWLLIYFFLFKVRAISGANSPTQFVASPQPACRIMA
jgi:hypothetical protein